PPDAYAPELEAARRIGAGSGAHSRGGRDEPGAGGRRRPHQHRRPRPRAGAHTMTIRPVEDIDFTARVESSSPSLVVTLVGNADLNVKVELDRFMIAVHEEARRVGAR